MILLIALIPATMLTIAGYFVLYLSHRSEGAFKAFGKYLGFWAMTLAGLLILGSLFASAHLGRGGMRGWHERHLRTHGPWLNELPPPGPGAPNAPPPAEPAAPPR